MKNVSVLALGLALCGVISSEAGAIARPTNAGRSQPSSRSQAQRGVPPPNLRGAVRSGNTAPGLVKDIEYFSDDVMLFTEGESLSYSEFLDRILSPAGATAQKTAPATFTPYPKYDTSAATIKGEGKFCGLTFSGTSISVNEGAAECSNRSEGYAFYRDGNTAGAPIARIRFVYMSNSAAGSTDPALVAEVAAKCDDLYNGKEGTMKGLNIATIVTSSIGTVAGGLNVASTGYRMYKENKNEEEYNRNLQAVEVGLKAKVYDQEYTYEEIEQEIKRLENEINILSDEEIFGKSTSSLTVRYGFEIQSVAAFQGPFTPEFAKVPAPPPTYPPNQPYYEPAQLAPAPVPVSYGPYPIPKPPPPPPKKGFSLVPTAGDLTIEGGVLKGSIRAETGTRTGTGSVQSNGSGAGSDRFPSRPTSGNCINGEYFCCEANAEAGWWSKDSNGNVYQVEDKRNKSNPRDVASSRKEYINTSYKDCPSYKDRENGLTSRSQCIVPCNWPTSGSDGNTGGQTGPDILVLDPEREQLPPPSPPPAPAPSGGLCDKSKVCDGYPGYGPMPEKETSAGNALWERWEACAQSTGYTGASKDAVIHPNNITRAEYCSGGSGPAPAPSPTNPRPNLTPNPKKPDPNVPKPLRNDQLRRDKIAALNVRLMSFKEAKADLDKQRAADYEGLAKSGGPKKVGGFGDSRIQLATGIVSTAASASSVVTSGILAGEMTKMSARVKECEDAVARLNGRK